MARIFEYFPDQELQCRCGKCKPVLPIYEEIEMLYYLRFRLNCPLFINSGVRCQEHNKAVGGRAGSIHLIPQYRSAVSSFWGGAAWDICRIRLKADISDLISNALEIGFSGIGVYDSFVHIDSATRKDTQIWTG